LKLFESSNATHYKKLRFYERNIYFLVRKKGFLDKKYLNQLLKKNFIAFLRTRK